MNVNEHSVYMPESMKKNIPLAQKLLEVAVEQGATVTEFYLACAYAKNKVTEFGSSRLLRRELLTEFLTDVGGTLDN